jgi:hypothetical protein
MDRCKKSNVTEEKMMTEKDEGVNLRDCISTILTISYIQIE